MQHRTIRSIEYWLGRPLCALLTLHRRVFERKAHDDSKGPNSILFIKLIEQGATVASYDALMRGAELAGAENCYFLVFDTNRAIIDILGIFPRENILVVRHDSFLHFSTDILRALSSLRRARIEASVDMEFFSRASAIIAYLSGAGRRAGLHRFEAEALYRGDLMTHRVQYNPLLHVALHYRTLVEALLLDPHDAPMPKIQTERVSTRVPVHVPAAATVESVARRVESLLPGWSEDPLILLNPNADDSLAQRKWPEERFVELARRLLDTFPRYGILLTGAPTEVVATEAIAERIDSGRVKSIAGQTSLEELLALYTMSRLLVTNDSGPGHFASMTKIHSIVLFGPETPAVFGPMGPNTHIVYRRLACSPCVSPLNHRFSPCTNNVCMQEIEVETVFALASRLLGSE